MTTPHVLSYEAIDAAIADEIVAKIAASSSPVELSLKLPEHVEFTNANRALRTIITNPDTIRKLESLTVHRIPFFYVTSMACADMLRDNKTLRKLELRSCLNGEFEERPLFEALESNTTLTKLDMSIRIAVDNINPLRYIVSMLSHPDSSLTTLELSFNSNHPTDISNIMTALATNRTLKTFKCHPSFITYNTISRLAAALKSNPTSLESLDLSMDLSGTRDEREKAGRAMSEAIKSHKKLHTLILRSGSDANDWIGLTLGDALKGNDSLRTLELWSVYVVGNNGKALIDGLKENSTLEVLKMHYNSGSSSRFYVSFAENVLRKVNPTLKTLKFDYNHALGDTGAIAIFEALANENNPLVHLSLRECGINAASLPALRTVLRNNKRLVRLNLSGNCLERSQKTNVVSPENTKMVIHSIPDALRTNTTLKYLDLEWCMFSPEIGTAFAEMLKVNTSLKRLNMNGSPFDNASITELADALSVNQTLDEIYLYLYNSRENDRNFNDDGLVHLAKVLETRNRTLKRLRLGRTHFGISPRGQDALRKAIVTNGALEIVTFNDYTPEYLKTAFEIQKLRLAQRSALARDLPQVPDNAKKLIGRYTLNRTTYNEIQRQVQRNRDSAMLKRSMGMPINDEEDEEDVRVCSIF